MGPRLNSPVWSWGSQPSTPLQGFLPSFHLSCNDLAILHLLPQLACFPIFIITLPREAIWWHLRLRSAPLAGSQAYLAPTDFSHYISSSTPLKQLQPGPCHRCPERTSHSKPGGLSLCPPDPGLSSPTTPGISPQWVEDTNPAHPLSLCRLPLQQTTTNLVP